MDQSHRLWACFQLAVGFALFALGNNRLAVANLRKMDQPGEVRALHVVLSMAVVALILIRLTVDADRSLV